MLDPSVAHLLKAAVPWLLLLLLLAFAVAIDPYVDRRSRQLVVLINGLIFLLLALQATEYLISEGDEPHDLLRFYAAALGYSIRPVLLILLMRTLRTKSDPSLLWSLAGMNAVVYLSSNFTGLAFTIEDNSFSRGPLGGVCLAFSAVLLIILTVRSAAAYWKDRRRESLLPVFNFLTITAAAVADVYSAGVEPVSFLSMAIIGCSIFYYIWLHLQFVHEHEEDLKAQQRIRIMISQIQPHFLFNTLSTIQALCDVDPQKASETTGKFAVYLRQNIDSLDQAELVPFDKEMEHTQIYADIEMTRFPNVRLERDIRDRDFSLPALTVQPLVENAIRHGVRIREEGVVRISTRRTAEGHEIVIWDNGKGFDPAAVKKAPGSHIGLTNVRQRIEQMCGGTLRVESRPGEGTTVTILLPGPEA